MPFLVTFLVLSPLRAPLPCVVPPSPPCLVPLSPPCVAPSPRLWMLSCGCCIARCSLLRPMGITMLEVASVIVATALFSAVVPLVVQLETNNKVKEKNISDEDQESEPRTDEEIKELTIRILNAGTEVVETKDGARSATLSMAYAAARLVESSLRALVGYGDVVKLGRKGAEALIPFDLQGLTEYEQKALEALKPKLKAGIEKGIGFAHKQTVAA
ncbi:hypothetical protein HN873_071081 [Arachis hypogaea]